MARPSPQNLRALFTNAAIAQLRVVEQPTLAGPKARGVSASAILETVHAVGVINTPKTLEDCVFEFVDEAPGNVVAAAVVTAEDIVAIHGADEQVFAMEDWAKEVFGTGATRDLAMISYLDAGEISSVYWRHPQSRHLLIIGPPEQMGLILIEGSDISKSVIDLNAVMTGLNYGAAAT